MNGERTTLYTLPASLPAVSMAREFLFLLVVRFRNPDMVDWNDLFEAKEGVLGGWMWKLEEVRRVCDDDGVSVLQ